MDKSIINIGGEMDIKYSKSYFFCMQKDIAIIDGERKIELIYGENFDMYINVTDNSIEDYDKVYVERFEICNKDIVYPCFLDFFENVLNCNIFEKEKLNKNIKDSGKIQNLVLDGIIFLYSEATEDKNLANLLKISKQDEKIVLEFCSSKNDTLDDAGFCIKIKRCSSYFPFNVCLSKLYQNLLNLNV